MKNNYLNDLQQQYDSPQNAYMAYILQKTLWREYAIGDNAPENIKKAGELQGKINAYCESMAAGGKKEFSECFGLTKQELMPFAKENMEVLDFMSIDRDLFIQLMTGFYEVNLQKSAKSITTWDALKDIMDTEKYTIAPFALASESIAKITKENSFNSIFIGKAVANDDLITTLQQNITQLQNVVECDKSQIGANKFNLFIDCEDMAFAGYSNQYFKTNEEKLYYNSRLMHDAFAHEWLHGMDSIWAKQRGLRVLESQTSNPVLRDLLQSATIINESALSTIKEEVHEKTIYHCHKIVDRYDNMGQISEPEKFKEFLTQVCNDTQAGKFNKEEFIKNITQFKTDNTFYSMEAFLCTELQTLDHMSNSKEFNNSFFYEYAKKMDINLSSAANSEFEEYSVTPQEMFARMFEIYSDYKLNSKGMENNISSVKNSYYIGHHEELKGYIQKWEPVIQEIKGLLDKICPLQENNEVEVKNNFTALSASQVKQAMKKMQQPASEVQKLRYN